MDSKTLAVVMGGVVAAAMTGAGVSAYKVQDEVQSLIAVTLPPVATAQVQVGPDYVLGLPDGGLGGYVANFRDGDGGVRLLRRQPGCVRRKLGGSSLLCRRGPSTLVNDVVAELNRFPAAEAQPAVNDCEPCACAVFFGEDANLDEAELLNSPLGGVVP